MWIAGLSVFAAVYGVTGLVGGGIASGGHEEGMILLLPFVGPPIYIGNEGGGAGSIIAMSLLGAIQATGFGLMIGGLVATRKVYLRNDVALVEPTITVGPGTLGLRMGF